jgi:hypothetical protein
MLGRYERTTKRKETALSSSVASRPSRSATARELSCGMK